MVATMPDVTVVINQPFDLIGAVLIPVAAILVSSAIAIWLARLERRAQRRGLVTAAVAQIMRELSRLARSHRHGDAGDPNQIYGVILAELNALAALAPRSDAPMVKFAAVNLFYSSGIEDAAKRASAINWIATCLELWSRGDITTRDLSRNMPPSHEGIWRESADLRAWESFIAPTKT